MASATAANGSTTNGNGVASPPLKRLNAVESVAHTAAVQVDSIYSQVKTMASSVPLVSSGLEQVEQVAAPVLSRVADGSDKLLRFADTQVDTALNTVNGGIKGVQDLHRTNLKVFSEATTSYFDMLAKAGDWAATKLNPVTGVQAARDALMATIAKAKEMTDPDVAIATVYDAWVKFSSIPAVTKALQTAEPVTKQAAVAAEKLHTAIVHNGLYKKGVDTGYSTLTWYTTTTPYKLAGKYLYPWVQPIADPAYDKLANSKVMGDLTTYWKPVAV